MGSSTTSLLKKVESRREEDERRGVDAARTEGKVKVVARKSREREGRIMVQVGEGRWWLRVRREAEIQGGLL